MPKHGPTPTRTRYSPCNPPRMLRHWKVLCEDIGERRAGTKGETAAANYLVHQFKRFSLAPVQAEPFPCTSVRGSRVELHIQTGQKFHRIPARSLVGAAATPAKGISGELVWIEMPEQARRFFTPALRGKIIVLFGPLPTNVDLHRKLVSLSPAAIIHVDDRLPFDWPKDDGVYPLWARSFGMPPTVTIPYRIAWDLKNAGARRAKLRVTLNQTQSTSQNVVGEIRGRRSELPLVLVSAHHDTQCNNTGADDNASGVVAVLELAAMFSRARPLRTIRFVSFGTEEQLSVGSAHYVQEHRNTLSGIGAVLNMDSIASVLGHNAVLHAGKTEFGQCVTKLLSQHGLDVSESADACPFVDAFPFTVSGIPSITLMRPNMIGLMRWQHHSAFDNLNEVSLAEAAKSVRAMAGLLAFLANRTAWPFSRGLAPEQQPRTAQLARGLYGMRV